MIDFDDLLTDEEAEPITDPVALFKELGSLRDPKYQSLWGDQQNILERWFNRRNDKDVLIKMNTGTGKTVIGLLIAQSSLNEKIGRALYLCPNNLLVEQVATEARKLGLSIVTDNDIDADSKSLPAKFMNAEAIYVTVFHRLFNGRSLFGIQADGKQPVEVGLVIVDDAHACLAIAREKSSIKIQRGDTDAEAFVKRFEDSLKQQALGAASEVLDCVPGKYLPVPYWTWIHSIGDIASTLSRRFKRASDQQKEAYRLSKATKKQQSLFSGKEIAAPTQPVDQEILFSWPLVRDGLEATSCFIGDKHLEITAEICSTHLFESLFGAKRRIYMTATLVDDSCLCRDMDVDPDTLQSSLYPSVLGDIGERLIIAAPLVDHNISLENIIALAQKIRSEGRNVVVLTPSYEYGNSWACEGAEVPRDREIEAAVNKLRSSKGHLVVLTNRYDGIDLPGDACRLLIMHGLPKHSSLAELYTSAARQTSRTVKAAIAQRVEQGMGRAVRSNTDYAAILIVGSELADFISDKQNLALFSAETRSQIEMGLEITAKKLKGQGLVSIEQAIRQCLDRDKGWIKVHQKKLVRTPPTQPNAISNDLAFIERKASLLFLKQRDEEAASIIEKAIDRHRPSMAAADQGWYLQLQAKYLSRVNPTRSSEIQLKAHDLNRNLLKSLRGVSHKKFTERRGAQAQKVLEWINQAMNANAVAVRINAILEKIAFGVRASDCEEAFIHLAEFLGIGAWRPEHEEGRGPDILWEPGQSPAMVLEVKSEVKLGREGISKSEVGQLANSINWYNESYSGADCVPCFFHPTRSVCADAYPPEGTKVICQENLPRFIDAIRNLGAGLSAKEPSAWSVEEVNDLLVAHNLRSSQIATFLLPYKT